MIMFMLLTTGSHPLYNGDEGKDVLVEKILNPIWNFPSMVGE